jgi:hypothetical protein
LHCCSWKLSAGFDKARPCIKSAKCRRKGQNLVTKVAFICEKGIESPVSAQLVQEVKTASSLVSSAAGIALHPVAFWPHHSGEKSPDSRLSALGRTRAMGIVQKSSRFTALLLHCFASR